MSGSTPDKDPVPASSESATAPDAHAVASNAPAAARGGAALIVGRLCVAALGWAGSIVVARSLPADQWGQFSFVFILLGLLAIVTDLGVGRVVVSRLIDDDEREVASTASSFVALRTFLGLVGYAVAVLYVSVMGYPAIVVEATAIAGLVVVVATPGNALTILFQSRHRLTTVAVAESAGQLLQLSLIVFAALYSPGLLIFVIPAVANEVLALGLKIRGLKRTRPRIRLAKAVEIRRWRPMLREALPLAAGFGLTLALGKVDVLMLSRLDDFDAVGMYSIGYKFSDILDMLAVAVAGPISTLLIAAWPGRRDEFRRRSRLSVLALGGFGLVALGAFWPVAGPLIGMLYGDQFAPSAFAARLLVVGAVFTMLVVMAIFLLASCGLHMLYPPLALGALVLNVILNFVLIPKMSYDGAAIATVATMALLFFGAWILIARRVSIGSLFPAAAMSGIAACTAVVAAAGWALESFTGVPWPVIAVVCGAGLPLLAWASHCTDGNDPRVVLRRLRGGDGS